MLSTCRHTAALTIFPVGTWETDSRGGYSLGIQKLQRIFPMFKFAIRDTICCAWRWHIVILFTWGFGGHAAQNFVFRLVGDAFSQCGGRAGAKGGGGLECRNPPP